MRQQDWDDYITRTARPAAERAANAFRRRHNATLRTHDREELIQHLLVAAWQTRQRFQPHRNNDFDGYLAAVLQKRCVDWYRTNYVDQRHGDTKQAANIRFPQSLEHPLNRNADNSDRTLADVVASPRSLDDPDLPKEVARLLRQGNQHRARYRGILDRHMLNRSNHRTPPPHPEKEDKR